MRSLLGRVLVWMVGLSVQAAFCGTAGLLEELLPSPCLMTVSLDDVPGWLRQLPETPMGKIAAQEAFRSRIQQVPTEWRDLLGAAGGWEILFSGQVLLAVLSQSSTEEGGQMPFSVVALARTRLTPTAMRSLLALTMDEWDTGRSWVPLEPENPTAWRVEDSLYVGLTGDVLVLTDRESSLRSIEEMAAGQRELESLADSEAYAPLIGQEQTTSRLFLDVKRWLNLMLDVSPDEDATAMRDLLEGLGLWNIERIWVASRWDPAIQQYSHQGELLCEGPLSGLFLAMASLEDRDEFWKYCAGESSYVSATGVDWCVVHSVFQEVLKAMPGGAEGMAPLEERCQTVLGVSVEEFLCDCLGQWVLVVQSPGTPPRVSLVHSLREASPARQVCEHLYHLSLNAEKPQLQISRQLVRDIPVYSLRVLPFLLDAPGWAVQEDRLLLSSSTSAIVEEIQTPRRSGTGRWTEDAVFAGTLKETEGDLTSLHWMTPPAVLSPVVLPFPTSPFDMEKASQPSPEGILDCETRLRAIRSALWEYHEEQGRFPSELEELLDEPYGLSVEGLGCPAGPEGNRYFYRAELDPHETELWVGDKEPYHDGVKMGLFTDGRVARIDPSSQEDTAGAGWKRGSCEPLDLSMLRPTWGFTKVREEGLVFRSQTNFLLPDSLVLGALAVLPQLEDLIEQFNETLAAPETLREM